jgi:cytochrome c biogenesis protein CcdA/thiol-disulfide isomerase/thioredoxin
MIRRLSVLALLTVMFTAQAEKHPATLYFFWGDGCPHCAAAEPFLDELANRYPTLEIRKYEVWYDADNRELLQEVAAAYGVNVGGVPAMFIGDAMWEGFADSLRINIENQVGLCVNFGCDSPYQPQQGSSTLTPTSAPNTSTSTTTASTTPAATSNQLATTDNTLTLPLLGTINLSAQPLLLTTSLIALVDGFNPCSLWVLSLLLAMVIHAGSRRKVFAVGATFLFVTASMYGLFIVGVFSTLSYVGYLRSVQIAVAVLALGFAAINIKDYWAFKRGFSLTINDSHKPKLYKQMRNVMAARGSTLAMIGTTAAMALGVTLVELPCTAGFPVIWSGIVSGQVTTTGFAGLLAVYLLIYLLDELLVFGTVVVTLKVSRFEEKHGRILKLIGGMVMLALGVGMLGAPDAMNNLSGSLVIFTAAALGTVAMIGLHNLWQKRQQHASV